MISEFQKEKYFCDEDWTPQTGVEFAYEIRLLAYRILGLFCLAVGCAMREIAR